LDEQNEARGGRASCTKKSVFPGATTVNHIAPILEELCFCTFFADYERQLFYFSDNMLELMGVSGREGTSLSDYVLFISERDRAEAELKYADFFRSAETSDSGKTSLFHALVRSVDTMLWTQVHMQIISEDGRKYIWGTVLDMTQSISGRILSQLFADGIGEYVFYYDIASDICYLNAHFMRVLNLKKHYLENASRKIMQYLHADDYRRVIRAFRSYIGRRTTCVSGDYRLLAADGTEIWLHSCGISDYDVSGSTRYITGLLTDISDSMTRFKEVVEKAVSTNEITKLPVRRRLMDDLEDILKDPDITSAALILIDVKGFRSYNDRFGRSIGDNILRKISMMIEKKLPEAGRLYHVSIDHFCLLWPKASRVQTENYMAFMLKEAEDFTLFEKEHLYVAFTMSAVLFPSGGSSAEDLLVNAEITLNKIKKENKKNCSIFLASDKKELDEKLAFQSQLSRSVRNTHKDFILHYQPVIDAGCEGLIGAEALLRWISPNNDIVSPIRVIAALEATGHMDGVGAWVLEEGIRQCSEWIRAGAGPDFLIHINITAEDLMRPNYSQSVISLLSKHLLNPGNLILEITETSLMKSIANCRQNLIRLRKAGVKISIDDFGTGYSSLNYLRELPVDEIKIDRAFLENIHKDRYNQSFISAMIILAHSIPRNVCIEGVETREQANAVRELGADVFQGFFYGRPVSPSEFETKYLCKAGKTV